MNLNTTFGSTSADLALRASNYHASQVPGLNIGKDGHQINLRDQMVALESAEMRLRTAGTPAAVTAVVTTLRDLILVEASDLPRAHHSARDIPRLALAEVAPEVARMAADGSAPNAFLSESLRHIQNSLRVTQPDERLAHLLWASRDLGQFVTALAPASK